MTYFGPRFSSVSVWLVVALAIIAASCTTYYTRAFRLCTPLDCAPPERVQDAAYAPFAELEGWRLYIHAVAIYQTNNLEANDRHVYDIRIQQRQIAEHARELSIDTLAVTFLPSGERHFLSSIRCVKDSGYYVPEKRRTVHFGNLSIPLNVDSVRVDFAVSVESGGNTEVPSSDYSLTMLRYEGTWDKFGIYPKD